MARKWFTAYFYHGYLKQLFNSFERHKDAKFSNVEIWYPYITLVVAKDGKKHEKQVPAFDNYVFFEFEEDSLVWMDITKRTPIIRFLTDNGSNLPISLTDSEVEHLNKITHIKKMVDYSYLIHKHVVIKDGPFKNLTGYCRSIIKGKYKAKVAVEMFNIVEREVEINLESLELITD